MSHDNIEIEIQVNIENPEPLLEFLEKNGIFVAESHQVDEYFSPLHDDFLAVRPTNRWLRLRESPKGCSINYKNWYFDEDGKSRFCDEYESKVENLEQMKKILLSLGFKSIVTVDKIRKVWKYADYEIGIDSVKNLGDYVEIEYTGTNGAGEHKKITEEMVGFLKNLNCGKITRNYRGYPFQLLFPEEVEYEIQYNKSYLSPL